MLAAHQPVDVEGLTIEPIAKIPQKTLNAGRALFSIAVALYVIYAALFIYRTSFVIDGVRYFSLFDDAMISMRYARNLVHGYGLVWNPGGPRVEGYTNPLWVAYMAGLHLLPVSQAKISLLVQIAAGAFLTANLFFVRKIALGVSEGSEPVALGAVVLTAAYLPINNWSLQGMEVSLLILIVSVCVWQAMLTFTDRVFRISLYVLLGVGTMVRSDMAVPFALFVFFLMFQDRPNWRRHLLWGSVVFVAFMTAQTLLRFWYFGEMFPNTYYLKLTGFPTVPRIMHGLLVLAQFVWKANLLLFFLPFTLAFRRNRSIWLLLSSIAVQMMYSAYVGGDAWEYWGGSNRYICIAMPGFFVLLSLALFHASRMNIGASDRGFSNSPSAALNWRMGAFAVLVIFSVVSFNGIYGGEGWQEMLLRHAPLHSGPGGENSEEVEQAQLLDKLTTANATLAVVRAGTIPYFSERPTIDLLGKNDRYIAHLPMRTSLSGFHRFLEFRPGHLKYDYKYSIGQLHPDVIVQLWEHPEEARRYLQARYKGVSLQGKCVYFRGGSPNVLWQNLAIERTASECND